MLYDSDEEVKSERTIDSLKADGEEERSKWVQCDNPDCQKWRRIDYMSDIASLSKEQWMCEMNEGKIKFFMISYAVFH